MELNDLIDHGIPKTVVRNWTKRHGTDKLTHLQGRVFSSDVFWNAKQNLIIQGQTSSGKTLVGEVAAANCMASMDRSAIYLVPFRAMIGEKYRDFEQAMGRDSAGWRIYPSSSDYQEYDSFISRGKYKLAVMVYEKLFALLAQPRNQILQNCGLIVVDECQLVGDMQRGPKLEFILSRMIGESDGHPRIVGLTTISTEVDNLVPWLNAEVITDPSRPKQLRESVCTLDGQCRIQIENSDGTIIAEETEKINLPRIYSKELDQLVLGLAQHHVTQGHRVLIFRSSKRGTEQTARNLAKILPKTELSRTVQEALEGLEEDDLVSVFRSNLFPHGVAYHHGGLPWEVRDLVEAQFKNDDGQVRVVVATETLAMGVNLPADVVIVADLRKGVGQSLIVDVSAQEYKNYVGRAGRFGKGNLEYGRSYLIAESHGQAETFWNKYIESKPTKVQSTFRGLESYQQATYMLNWIAYTRHNDKYVLADYLNSTLAYANYSEEETVNRVDALLSLLEKSELVSIRNETIMATGTGEALAGFALSLSTISHLKRLRSSLAGYKAEDLPILDMLYAICATDEIEDLNDPDVTKQDFFTNKPLRKLLVDTELPIAEDSELDILRKQNDSPNTPELRAMKRALLLWYWRSGRSMRDIRRESDLAGFTSGDLSRMADVAAFLIEALAALCEKYSETEDLGVPLRALAGTIQYGIPSAAVPLANQHVRGITRPMLRKLCEDFPRIDLVAHILLERDQLQNIPPIPRRRLIDALTRRLRQGQEIGHDEHRTLVSRWIRQGVLDEGWRDSVHELYTADSAETLQSAVFSFLSSEAIRFTCTNISDFALSTEMPGESGVIDIVAVYGQPEQYLDWTTVSNAINSLERDTTRIVVGSPDFEDNAKWKAKDENLLVLTPEVFAQACFRSIAETRSGIPLGKFFSAHRGHASMANIDDLIREYVKNGVATEEGVTMFSEDEKRLDVFLAHASPDKDQFVKPFAEALSTAGISYWLDEAEITWGDSITSKINDGLEKCKYVVLFLSDEFVDRKWTNAELQSALNRQNTHGAKVVLPLILGDRDKLMTQYPLLSDLQSPHWEQGIDNIIEDLKRLL